MVSIHLILLFIRFGKVPVIVTQMFQYISCYSLSGSIGELSVVNRLFQYISCYSLSVTGNTYGAKDVRFNTSHVTLYPFGHHFLFWNGLFQYISCYSLSGYSFLMRKQFPVSIHLMLLFIAKQLPDGRFSDEFQYISYYSLSITIQNQFGFQYSFNTSHVTLYRLSYRNSYQLHLGFNTSHVTLYPSINLV